jgi:hypothetical protein
MNPAYQHLPLSDVKPGMVLSDELLDRQGQVLLPKGAILTAQTISLLPSHGIGMLAVQRDAEPGPQQGTPEGSVVEARIDHVFRHNDPDNHDDWASGILRRYLLDYRLNREVEL